MILYFTITLLYNTLIMIFHGTHINMSHSNILVNKIYNYFYLLAFLISSILKQEQYYNIL